MCGMVYSKNLSKSFPGQGREALVAVVLTAKYFLCPQSAGGVSCIKCKRGTLTWGSSNLDFIDRQKREPWRFPFVKRGAPATRSKVHLSVDFCIDMINKTGGSASTFIFVYRTLRFQAP